MLAILGFGLTGCSTLPFGDDDSSESATLKPTKKAETVRVETEKAKQYSGLAPTPVTDQPKPTDSDYTSLVVPEQAPPLGTTNFTPVAPSELNETGTLVGLKVQQLRNDLVLLQNSISQQNETLQNIRNRVTQNTQFYHTIVASISTRLQVGTTPGNPVLIDQWNKAQNQLNLIAQNIADMNNLSNSVAGSATLSGYLLDAVKAAYTLSGAVEEDHRQLGILENDINRTMVLVDRLLGELSRDVARQTNYLNNEKRNLTALSLAIKNGEMYGRSLSSLSTFGVGQPAAMPWAQPVTPVGSTPLGAPRSSLDPSVLRDPLMVIKFDKRQVPFEEPLYNAVSRVLERKPDAGFELVAVTPTHGSAIESARVSYQAQKNAKDVLESMLGMGLQGERISLTEVQDPATFSNEVRIYLR